MKKTSITRFAWLSIMAAVLTIALKSSAYYITGSVGLLSDAIESGVNLAAAIFALLMLKIAELPPDAEHEYGHTKAEYFASIIEGFFIIIAAISIGTTAIERFMHPRLITEPFTGIGISAVASVINLLVALALLQAGKKHNSITLEADGHHLMTDVWTSVGVICGIILVAITKVYWLDPVIAFFIAFNIIFTGYKIIRKSTNGLMDSSMPRDEVIQIKKILDKYCTNGITYHGLRTRESATRRFISVHILVPGRWSVKRGHDLLEVIEKDMCASMDQVTVFTHLEPAEDPSSLEDMTLERS